jgi:hypothetical protein
VVSVDPRWEQNQEVFRAAMGSVNELIPALARIIDTGAWREFMHPMDGLQRFDSFVAYCQGFLELDPVAIEVMLDRTNFKAAAKTVRKMMREDIAPVARHGEIGNGRVDNDESRGDNVTSTQRGNDESYLIARLKRDDPDLATEVVEGRMSAHAAAVKAGIKKPTATVPVDSPENAIRALLRRFTKIQLIAALTIMEDE